MKRNRVNVLTVVNSASNITTETIDGKPHIVVRGITPVVDDIVMNRKLYPAAEIEKAYNTLERNPMPLGHPKVDGKHVSARDVRAVNEYHVGAWLQNVSHEDGKVTGDMYVNRHRLDEMISGTNSEPIHISTGLLYSGIAANGESKGKKYNEIATNMMFDHVAVLLDEPGAGTPEEGVGIFVNSEGHEQQIEVARLADGIDCTREGLLNKTKFFFTNASKAKALTDQVMALNSKINANSESEKTNMRAAVKAKFGMTDIAVNALDGEPLKELFAQCQTSTGLNGAFRQATNTQSVSEMPE
ncbi:DUF2213 domain-containing protein [Klebsiella pneumoniae]